MPFRRLPGFSALLYGKTAREVWARSPLPFSRECHLGKLLLYSRSWIPSLSPRVKLIPPQTGPPVASKHGDAAATWPVHPTSSLPSSTLLPLLISLTRAGQGRCQTTERPSSRHVSSARRWSWRTSIHSDCNTTQPCSGLGQFLLVN